MSNSHIYYLIEDWTDVPPSPPGGNPCGPDTSSITLTKAFGDDVFDAIQQAREKGRKIVVWQLGKCVIDWS